MRKTQDLLGNDAYHGAPHAWAPAAYMMRASQLDSGTNLGALLELLSDIWHLQTAAMVPFRSRERANSHSIVLTLGYSCIFKQICLRDLEASFRHTITRMLL